MEIGERVAVALNRLAQIVRHAPVGVHVEQDRSGVADQAIGPTRDHAGADDSGQRVHPEPAERAGEQQSDNDQHRNRRVGDHVDDGGAHVVVAAPPRRALARALRTRRRNRLAPICTCAVNACGSGISSTDSR